MMTTAISDLDVFLAIADAGSLRAAGRALGLGPPAVTKRLQRLEDTIGTPLFVRTTRAIALTDAGRALVDRARPAVHELEAAIEDARASATVRKGAVRVTLPYLAYELTLAPHLPAFHRRYPDIELELSFDEAFVDISEQGFHVGIRLGDHIRDDMIAFRLTRPLTQAVFAAPDYLARNGTPERPADLLAHNCIRYRYIASRRIAEWEFEGDAGRYTVDVGGNLIVDSTTAMLSAARAGVGLAWLFHDNLIADFDSGHLVSVLDEHVITSPGHFLYFPRAHAKTGVVRAFVDFMREVRPAGV